MLNDDPLFEAAMRAELKRRGLREDLFQRSVKARGHQALCTNREEAGAKAHQLLDAILDYIAKNPKNPDDPDDVVMVTERRREPAPSDLDITVFANPDPGKPEILILAATSFGKACVETHLAAMCPLKWTEHDGDDGKKVLTTIVQISEDAAHPREGQAPGLAVSFRAMGCNAVRMTTQKESS
jgi:hypothetical protein